jgi:hypothetical protein
MPLENIFGLLIPACDLVREGARAGCKSVAIEDPDTIVDEDCTSDSDRRAVCPGAGSSTGTDDESGAEAVVGAAQDVGCVSWVLMHDGARGVGHTGDSIGAYAVTCPQFIGAEVGAKSGAWLLSPVTGEDASEIEPQQEPKDWAGHQAPIRVPPSWE